MNQQDYMQVNIFRYELGNAVNKSERGLKELRNVLYACYSRRMSDRLNMLWDTGKLDQARLDEINQTDLHQMMSTPKGIL